MDKQRIIDYVMQSPQNSNPAVLGSLLDQYSGGSAPTEKVVIAEEQTVTVTGSDNFTPVVLESIASEVPVQYWTVVVDGHECICSVKNIDLGDGMAAFTFEGVTLAGVLGAGGQSPTLAVVNSIGVGDHIVSAYAEPSFSSGSYTIDRNSNNQYDVSTTKLVSLTGTIPSLNFRDITLNFPVPDGVTPYIVIINGVYDHSGSPIQETLSCNNPNSSITVKIPSPGTQGSSIIEIVTDYNTLSCTNNNAYFVTDKNSQLHIFLSVATSSDSVYTIYIT